MRISLDWLKDYINLSESTERITELLTFSGIEVEGVTRFGEIPESVITCKVIECSLLEGSGHLQVCKVDTGSEVVQVVCGAANCVAGTTGVLALPGTILGETEIKKTKIKGTESCGMLCSEKELNLSDDHRGIIILPDDTPIGLSIRELLKLPDTLFELEITPNRPDLLGYHGLATDLAAGTSFDLKFPPTNIISNLEDNTDPVGNYLTLTNQEPESCPRYTARVLRNVTIKESPLWLRCRLIKSGLRPINNIVDITNFVMLETGHPLHAFDYDKLEGKDQIPEIIIRKAGKGEIFPALNGISYNLTTENLVIADGKKGIALAGVIGGANSHITESTKNVVLETACFLHTSMRKTSYQHKITTDSSYRFERHLSPETCDYASERAALMIVELAGASLCEGFLDDWQNKKEHLIVPLRPSRFNDVIGLNLDYEQITQYLSKLGLKPADKASYYKQQTISGKSNQTFETEDDHEQAKTNQSALYFEIPPKRIDLTREIDLIEEVVRLHGMDNIPSKTSLSFIMERHLFEIKNKVFNFMVYNGFHEVVNLSFSDPDFLNRLCLKEDDYRLNQIFLLNPQNSNLSSMRTTFIPQLINNARFNINHSVKQIKIFELNKIFLDNLSVPKNEPLHLCVLVIGSVNDISWKRKTEKYNFFTLKGLLKDLLNLLGIDDIRFEESDSSYLDVAESRTIVHEQEAIAEFGKLKADVASRFDIDLIELKQDIWIADVHLDKVIEKTRNSFVEHKTPPKYPSIERDLSFIISKEITHSMIVNTIYSVAESLVTDVFLLDEYRGKQIPENYRSLSYRLVFNDPEKTLTDCEVSGNLDSVLSALKNMWNIQLR